MSDSISISSVSYSVSSVSTLPKDFKCEAGKTLIKFKTADKKQFAVQLPAVSLNFIQAFVLNDKGAEAVQDFIESLQARKAKQVYEKLGRSVCDADLTIEALSEIALAGSENVRLTKELILACFANEWRNTIAYALVLERDAVAAAMLLNEDETEEATAAKQAFWSGEQGAKYLAIAENYKQFLLYGAERSPSFVSQAIKDKVLVAVSYLDQESQAVQKLSEKLTAAPVASVDAIAL